jgi:hypothetical protein
VANHCSVKTKKPMRRPTLDAFFTALSRDVFHGLLTWTVKDTSWMLTVAEGEERFNRACWLETSRHFEISHGGGGGDFAFWIDIVVANDLALAFNGTIVDDGDGVRRRGRPGIYRTFEAYCTMLIDDLTDPNPVCQDMLRRWQLQWRSDYAPPSFRFDTGKKIYVSGDVCNLILSEEPLAADGLKSGV